MQQDREHNNDMIRRWNRQRDLKAARDRVVEEAIRADELGLLTEARDLILALAVLEALEALEAEGD